MCRAIAWGWLVMWLGARMASGQDQAATQPAMEEAAVPITARVLAVTGDAQHKPLDGETWTACQVGDEYPQETMVRTGVRSSLKLQVGEDDTYTAVVVEAATKTVLSELFRTDSRKRVRIGVGYGKVRAGVVEGGLESDFTVDSPVATLSKRGTWDFGLFYERGTDRFEIFLHDRGLVDAFNRITQTRREVLPGEVVKQTMLRWMDEAQLARNVAVNDILGQSEVGVAFNRLRTDGLRVLDPEGGQAVLIDLSSSASQQVFARHAALALGPGPALGGLQRQSRPEGYFGTGRGDQLIPIIIEASSPLAQKGFARPGRYVFRRDALEGWLAGRK